MSTEIALVTSGEQLSGNGGILEQAEAKSQCSDRFFKYNISPDRSVQMKSRVYMRVWTLMCFLGMYRARRYSNTVE